MVKDVYPADEQGIKKQETEEEISQDMETGDKEEDAEISPEEEGYVEGATEVECENCNTLTSKEDAIIATDSEGKKHYFCSEECAEEKKE